MKSSGAWPSGTLTSLRGQRDRTRKGCPVSRDREGNRGAEKRRVFYFERVARPDSRIKGVRAIDFATPWARLSTRLMHAVW